MNQRPWRKDAITPGDFRAYSQRFQGANVDVNLTLVEALRRVAETRGAQGRGGWLSLSRPADGRAR